MLIGLIGLIGRIGPIRLIGPIKRIGPIGLIRPISLISPISPMGISPVNLKGNYGLAGILIAQHEVQGRNIRRHHHLAVIGVYHQ